MTDGDLAVVFQGDSLMEAELVKGLLEAEGIHCEIPGELATDQITTAEQVIGGDQLEIRVPTKDAARAREVIRQAVEDGRKLEGFIAEHPDAITGEETPE